MISNSITEQLLKENFIKKCPIDQKAIKNLLKRARIDLKTAKRNLDQDEECAYNYAYNTLLRSGIALMFSQGFRPDIKNKHLTVVRFAGAVLGKEFKQLINNYDFMRKNRNRFIYEPEITCSKKDAKNAIKTAETFVDKILNIISLQDPHHRFNFPL